MAIRLLLLVNIALIALGLYVGPHGGSAEDEESAAFGSVFLFVILACIDSVSLLVWLLKPLFK